MSKNNSKGKNNWTQKGRQHSKSQSDKILRESMTQDTPKRSNWHNATVTIGGDDREGTHYYVCSKCNNPCDLTVTNPSVDTPVLKEIEDMLQDSCPQCSHGIISMDDGYGNEMPVQCGEMIHDSEFLNRATKAISDLIATKEREAQIQMLREIITDLGKNDFHTIYGKLSAWLQGLEMGYPDPPIAELRNTKVEKTPLKQDEMIVEVRPDMFAGGVGEVEK